MNNGSRAARQLRNSRKNAKQTQLQLGMDTNYPREAISQQERGEYRVQPTLTHYFEQHGDPWVAMEAASEYSNWGSKRLDGKNVDLHRASVTMKLEEELEEAIEAIDNICVANHPSSLSEFERQDLKEALVQVADVRTGVDNFLAVMCEEYLIPWKEVWDEHDRKLQARGYVTN